MPAEPIISLCPAPDPARPNEPAPTDTAPLERLLLLREAAAVIRMSPSWLWQATRRGEVKCVRLGRSVRYDKRDLLAFIDAARS
jgi:predicted DNA-binding transcriptional regulator AlpA